LLDVTAFTGATLSINALNGIAGQQSRDGHSPQRRRLTAQTKKEEPVVFGSSF
jgi:hypothetical protein